MRFEICFQGHTRRLRSATCLRFVNFFLPGWLVGFKMHHNPKGRHPKKKCVYVGHWYWFKVLVYINPIKVFNRLSKSVLFYKPLCHSYINRLSLWPFSSKSSNQHYSQIVTTRHLKFWHNVHYPLCVTCLDTWHISGVICHL